MGIQNKGGALYFATGIDNTGLYADRREAIGIIKAMAGEITSFDVFGGIGISAGIAFAQAAKEAYNFEKQFQQSMKEVATLSSGIKGSLTDYMNSVIEMTRVVPVGAVESAKALYQIVSAGHDGADAMNILEVSAKAAVGGVTETATSADAITTILNAYKKSASEAESVSDMLFTTARLGKTTMGELGKSIAQAAPIAASYGVDIEQLLAAVATLTKQGTPTAQAMTQIRASIIAVSKVLGDGAFDNRTYQEALAEVARQAGGSESKLRELVPEVEAVNAVLGLTGINVQEAAGHLGEMQNATGAAEAAFKEMVSSAENQMKLLGNNITATLRPMGEAILKEVSSIASAFNKAFENGDVQESMKTLGDLIVIVTSAFVGYKGSIIATTAAKTAYHAITVWITKQKSIEAANLVLTKGLYAIEATMIAKNTAMHVLLTNALKAQFAAAMKATAAMLANPYVLAAIAVAGLGYAIYKLATAETAAEKAQRTFNESIKNQQSSINKLKNDTKELVNIIRDESVTYKEKHAALLRLQNLMPSVFKNLDIEKIKKMEILDIDQKTTEELELQERVIARTQLVLKQKEQSRAEKTYNDLSDTPGVSLSSLNDLKKDVDTAKEEVKLAQEYLNKLLNTQEKVKKAFKDAENIELESTNLEKLKILRKELKEAENDYNKLMKPNAHSTKDQRTAAKNKVEEIKGKINEFLPNTSKQESAAEKLRKEQEKRNEELLTLQRNNQKSEIDLMKEGSKKKIAQIELDYKNEIAAIKKQEEEWSKAQGGKLTDKQSISISEAYTKTEDKKDKGISDVNKEDEEKLKVLLNEYQDYTAQRLAIETKYNADIAALEEQRVKAVKNGDTQQVEKIDRAKTQATKNKGKELMSMDYDKLKESPEYVRAFENLKRTSSETLNSLLSQLENAKQTAAKVLSPDQLREYTTTIQEIMDELDSRNPFQSLIDRKAELAEAENALAIASAQLDAVQNRGAKIETGAKNIRLNEKTGKIESEKTYLSATEALKKYNEAKDETITANAKVEEAERKVDDVMGELFDSIKNIGSAVGGEAGEIIGIIGDIGQFALMTMSSIDVVSKTTTTAIQAVEKASVILAIIGAAIQIATKIASLFNGTDYMEEFRKELSKLNYELELAKLNAEISTDEKSIFGDDLWGNAIKNVKLANDSLSHYNETLDQIANRKKYTGFMGAMADAKGLKNTYDSLGDSIANMQLKIRHKTWFRSAKYASLKDAVPELFNEDGSINQTALEEFIGSDTFEKLSQENQKYLQEMSDYWKAYQDSVEQVKDYLSDIFGDLGGTLTDTLVDAFANGTDAAQAFTDSVSEMLEQMGKQMIFHAVFKDIFEKTQQQMLDVTQNENLSDDDKFKEYVDILGGMTDEVMGEQDKFNALLEAYQKMAAEKGIDIFKPSDSSKETLDSFVSQMQSAFTSLDVTAKDVSDNIYDYFRQAMINALYEKEYKSKMEELYKSFEDKSADGLSESDMAQLGAQVDQYINEMLKGVEGVNSLFADKLKDAADIQSFVDSVKGAMSSIEATAEDVTDNIFEYIRQQMVDKMFADTFQPQIEEFYKKVQAAMSDGSVTDEEKDALRKEAEKLANDITSAKDILSDTLGVTADNLKKEAEAEFKSFSDGILSSLYSAEVTAEAIAKNIADSMRQELIKAMYIEQYEPRIRAIWDKWKEYSSDGLVTDEERASIKDDINDLSKEVADAAKDISDAWTEAGDAVYDTFESFSNSIKSVLQNAETTAEDVAKNIYQFMRNALVNSMFAEQVQPQIKAWYDKYAEYMKDGAIDTTERKTLDEMIAEIQKAGMEIVDAANGLFPSLDTGAIQEAENARNEAEQEWESFSDSMLNSLYDIEASASDISDDMSEYMRKALIKAMYVNNYKPQMQKWYDEWQRAMGDDIITSEEKQNLDSMKQEMLDGMKKEADAINQMFDSMYSQEASSKGFEGMSQDTGEELNGRFTAFQSSNEEIKNQLIIQTGLNADQVRILTEIYTMTSEHFSERSDMMMDVLEYLEGIKKDTAHLYFIRESLKKIETNSNRW